MLGAADTFRAVATEQPEGRAQRAVRIVTGAPAAIRLGGFDAIARARGGRRRRDHRHGGRLHNQDG